MSFVYALCDPRTEEVRYVGQTGGTVEHRLNEHLWNAQKGVRLYLYNWVRSLKQPPTYFILEECGTREELNDAERFWIDWYRRLGVRLTNLTDGGDGFLGGH